MIAVAKSVAAAIHLNRLEDALDAFAINTWFGRLDTLTHVPKGMKVETGSKVGIYQNKIDMAKVLYLAYELSKSILRNWEISLLNLVKQWFGDHKQYQCMPNSVPVAPLVPYKSGMILVAPLVYYKKGVEIL